MTYTGRCNCGAVSLSIDAEPLAVRQCWCSRCRKIAGGGPTNNAIFPDEAVSVSGTLAESSYKADSGNQLTHAFCPACGTQMLGQSDARPHQRVVRIGALDDGHAIKPTIAIWVEEAPAEAFIDPLLERWPRQKPPSGSPSPS